MVCLGPPHSRSCAVLLPQELLSQDGFPSEKVTNLEKSHFLSSVLRCAPVLRAASVLLHVDPRVCVCVVVHL